MNQNSEKKIWVCLACGKRSNDRYGNNVIDRGWDESCVLNSIEVFEDQCVIKNNRVVKIEEKKYE